MLFKRKRPLSFIERLRLAFWPVRNWNRSISYILMRIKRLPSSPHRIAVGCAVGVFAIFTPFLGLQILLAGILAVALRGSIVASLLASFAGNPLTYPVIWFTTYNLGKMMLGGAATAKKVELGRRVGDLWDSILALSPDGIWSALESLWPLLKPMAVGSLPLGGLAAIATYVGIHRAITAYQASKLQKSHLRAAAL